MSISSIGTSSYSDVNGITSPLASQTSTPTVSNAASSTSVSKTDVGTPGVASNNSNLSSAIRLALAQMNAGGGLSSLLTSDSQQSTSDFMSNLFSSLPGLSSSGSTATNPISDLLGTSSSQAPTPVQLDQSSSTIKLQTSIQKLISQLDGGSSTSDLFGSGTTSNASSGFTNLQQSFNNLITASGGNPSQTSLQSFLKTVAANIQGSASIGSLFDASA